MIRYQNLNAVGSSTIAAYWFLGEASVAVLFERCNGFKDWVDLHTFMAGLPVSGTDSVQVA